MRPLSACLIALLLLASPATASGPETARVRALDSEALKLLERVRGQSATARRLCAKLEASDLITYVRIAPSFEAIRATTRIVGATPQTRFVLISISTMTAENDRVLLLGHELQHAAELADAPWVRDEAAMIEMYERIGWRHTSRAFETPEAVEAGRTVREEVAATLHLARNGTRVPDVQQAP